MKFLGCLRSTKPNFKYLCYRNPKSNIYIMANRDGKVVGRMVAIKEFVKSDIFYPNMSDYYSLYIKRLFVDKEFRKKGAGKAFINIAKKESFERGCNGNVHLIAKALEPMNFPQKFYRKQGLDSQYKYQMEILDKSIQNNSNLSASHWQTPMYLPH